MTLVIVNDKDTKRIEALQFLWYFLGNNVALRTHGLKAIKVEVYEYPPQKR